MDKITFDKNGNFVVRESKFINYIVGFTFLALLSGVLVTRGFEVGQDTSDFYFIYVGFSVGAILFFIKGTRKRTSIIINPAGIYYQGRLITNWENFLTAFIRQESYNVSDGVNDRFKIVVEYSDTIKGGNFLYPIPTSGTQDKSEYQIISAISYFSGKKLTYEIFD